MPSEEGVTPYVAIWSRENQFSKNLLPAKLDGISASHV